MTLRKMACATKLGDAECKGCEASEQKYSIIMIIFYSIGIFGIYKKH